MYVCVTISSGVLEYITIVPINYRVFLIRFLSRVITMYFINKKTRWYIGSILFY